MTEQKPFGAFGDKLRFEAHEFVYYGKRYAYADVRGMEFKQKTFTVREANGTVTYESQLRVLFANGKKLVLRPDGGVRKILSTRDTYVFETMASAADWIGAYTFNYRMDVYEAEFKSHKYATFGAYQIAANADLFYRNAFCLNLRDENVRCMMYAYHMACLRKPKKWWKRALTFWLKRSERIDLRRDRDCFLYFMQRHINLKWPSETLRVYRGIAADGTDTTTKPQEAPKADANGGATPNTGSSGGGQQQQQSAPPPPKPKTMPTSTQHLATLGLTPEAKWDQVKSTYRQLAKKYHPDLMRGRGASPATLKEAEESLKGINEAYGWLEDFYKLKN